MPIGGIGTGTVSLGGRGDLRDFELANRPAKGFTPLAFFVLRCEGAAPRVLEGELAPPYDGWEGVPLRTAGLPRFRECSFAAAYPFGLVHLADPAVPCRVRLEAFNPLVPGDADASGIPTAVLRFVLENAADEPLAASVCGCVENAFAEPRRNETRPGGVLMHAREGTVALAVLDGEPTLREAWADVYRSDALLDLWNDFAADGRLDARAGGLPVASVAASLEVPAHGETAITFLLAWRFPDRRAWDGTTIVGNHYATRFGDAWSVVEHVAEELPRLEAATRRFVDAFTAADVPAAIKEAALFNLVPLRSQTSFRTADGRFFGWEGCTDDAGACIGSCTHVWNYDQATPFLFGELARSMREVEFLHATRDDGHMSFRAGLPLERATEFGVAAADGQMGCIVKLYREWQLSGDDAFLRRLWPAARRALEFAWIPGGWDADRDGVMEGTQHVTMDVELYGPNPLTGFWYLAALRAAAEMARHMGDADFGAECEALFARGRAWLDEHLWNGEWYEHEIGNPGTPTAPGLARTVLAEKEPPGPHRHQLGSACLADQLVGDLAAQLTGLGSVVEPERARTTLASIHRHNFRRDLRGHVNQFRTFALADEPALVNAVYPRGGRPARPAPYVNEVWTGVEYTAAAGMIAAGLVHEGLECVAAVRGRYDGRRRNPFDEIECGHHYARSLAAWGTLLAWTGFRYSAVERTMRFRATGEPSRWFWSTGSAWGTFAQAGRSVTLEVLFGAVPLRRIVLDGRGTAEVESRSYGRDALVTATIA